MILSILEICSLRAITSSAKVWTSFAMAFSPGIAVYWCSAASTDVSARVPALRTLRLASHFVSRATPARRMTAGVW